MPFHVVKEERSLKKRKASLLLFNQRNTTQPYNFPRLFCLPPPHSPPLKVFVMYIALEIHPYHHGMFSH